MKRLSKEQILMLHSQLIEQTGGIDELPPHTRDFSRELGGFTCTIKVRMV